MSEVLEKEKLRLDHKPADRCPHYDNDCKYVNDHLSCWAYSGDDDPFPGVCPFVFGQDA